MKRKNLLLGACTALVSLVAFGVSACGGGHTHAYQEVITAPAQPEGWQEGWIDTAKTYHVVWGASW